MIKFLSNAIITLPPYLHKYSLPALTMNEVFDAISQDQWEHTWINLPELHCIDRDCPGRQLALAHVPQQPQLGPVPVL